MQSNVAPDAAGRETPSMKVPPSITRVLARCSQSLRVRLMEASSCSVGPPVGGADDYRTLLSGRIVFNIFYSSPQMGPASFVLSNGTTQASALVIFAGALAPAAGR